MKIFRRVVFFLFAAAFLIGAPRLVFYALGVSYKSGSQSGLVKTGLIYLSSTPPGASIFIGGRPYRESTPAMIRDLQPGAYSVRLDLKNHFSWNGVVPVGAGKAAVLGHILLRPKKPEWKTLLRDDFSELFAVSETNYILLRHQSGELRVYDRREKGTRPLFSGKETRDFRLRSVHFVAGGKTVLLEGGEERQPEWVWTRLDSDQAKKTILHGIPDADRIFWDPGENRQIFALKENTVSRFDLRRPANPPQTWPVAGFAARNNRAYFLQEDTLAAADLNGKNVRILEKDPALKEEVDRAGFYEIFPLAGDVMLFLNSKGRLAVNHPLRVLMQEGVRGFDYDAKARKVLVWTKNTLAVIQFPETETEKSIPIQPRTVYGSGDDIRRAWWAHSGSHVVFQDGQSVYLKNTESFSDQPAEEILQTKGRSLAHYSEDSGEVFYLDRNTGNLMALEVIPKWKVLEVPRNLIQELQDIQEKDKGAAA